MTINIRPITPRIPEKARDGRRRQYSTDCHRPSDHNVAQNPVRQDPSFYPDKSYARASGQANSNDSAAAAPERRTPKSTRVGAPDFGWG